MRKQIAVFLFTAILLSFAGCAGGSTSPAGSTADSTATSALSSAASTEQQPQSSYHKITADEAKAMMDEGGVTVVDVRRADEYEAAHIPGAILLSNETIADTAPDALTDKDAALLVYCRTGVRSKQASDTLVSLGYTQVYDMGGIVDWPYETQSGAAKE